MSITNNTVINLIMNFQDVVTRSKSAPLTKEVLVQSINNIRFAKNREQYDDYLHAFIDIVDAEKMNNNISRNLNEKAQATFVELQNLVPAFTNTNTKEETMTTNNNTTDVTMDLINELRNRLLQLEKDNTRLKNILMNKGLATTHTLNRWEFNYEWLVKIGVNPVPLNTDLGKELVAALQICSEGQWFKLRFTRAFYKAHTKKCQNLLKKVSDLAHERGHGARQTKAEKGQPTWLLVSHNPNPNAQEQTEEQEEEMTF